MTMPARTTYTVGIRDTDEPSIIREHHAITAAVLDSGVLRVTIEPHTETYFAPGQWVYMNRTER